MDKQSNINERFATLFPKTFLSLRQAQRRRTLWLQYYKKVYESENRPSHQEFHKDYGKTEEMIFHAIEPMLNVAILEKMTHILHLSGNYPFDGILLDTHKSRLLHVECARCYDGDNDVLRNGINAKSTILNPSIVSSSENIVSVPSNYSHELLRLIEENIQKKIKIDYPFTKGVLIVSFNDDHLIKNRMGELKESLQSMSFPENNCFEKCYIVGIQGKELKTNFINPLTNSSRIKR